LDSVTRYSAPERQNSQTSFDGLTHYAGSEQRNSKTSFGGVTRRAGQFGVELDHVFWRFFGVAFVELAYLWEYYGMLRLFVLFLYWMAYTGWYVSKVDHEATIV
jgi:hypothetical protein